MEPLPVVTSARESDKRRLKMWLAASAVGLAETLCREAMSVKFLAHLLDLIPQLTERNGSDQDRRRIKANLALPITERLPTIRV